MHREPLLGWLDEYEARNLNEAGVVERFRRFMAAHQDCFERTCVPGHITGSAWLVDRSGHRVLLTHHRKLDIWVQLGGHSDGDADTRAVAQREAEEESGLPVELVSPVVFDLDIHEIPARGSEPAHDHFDVRFAVQVSGSEAFVVSSESKSLAWVGERELVQLTSEKSMHRMAQKWRQWRTTGVPGASH